MIAISRLQASAARTVGEAAYAHLWSLIAVLTRPYWSNSSGVAAW